MNKKYLQKELHENKLLLKLLKNNDPLYLFNAKKSFYFKIKNKYIYNIIKFIMIYYLNNEINKINKKLIT